MGWFSSKKEASTTGHLPWKKLTEQSQLDEILHALPEEKHLIFKHSTRCSISAMALRRFETEWTEEVSSIHIWYLDLLNHRDISNAIAEKTGVVHQSPQVIVLQNGKVTYEASHGQISLGAAVKSLS